MIPLVQKETLEFSPEKDGTGFAHYTKELIHEQL
jgi:hypothetical protein